LPSVRGGQPQVACERDEEPAADRITLQHRDRRLAQAGQSREHAGESGLVAERCGPELQELADVGAGREGPVAGALQNEDAHARIDVEPHARVVERERHGIARVGPVEGEERDRTLALDEDVAGHPCRRRESIRPAS
jgi:hypothetical protein